MEQTQSISPTPPVADSNPRESTVVLADAGSALPNPVPNSDLKQHAAKSVNESEHAARQASSYWLENNEMRQPDSPPEAALQQDIIVEDAAMVVVHEAVPSVPGASLLGPAGDLPDSDGYECSDDMECLSMRHCRNCTATLWTDRCSECDHRQAEDHLLFRPVVEQVNGATKTSVSNAALPTVLAYDERMTLHAEGTGSTHPERPDRVKAIMARLAAAELDGQCRMVPGREATQEEIETCHTPALALNVDITSERSRLAGGTTMYLKSDTYVNEHTAMCARLSAGACVDVAEAVVRGEARAGAAICRPPGHHAESNTSMGFCFYNNAAIAARAAQRAGASKVLIFDWDIHHGNGTQQILEDDPSVLYISIHRHDHGSFYPGTGSMYAVGAPGAEGSCVNVGWPCGDMCNGDYMAAMHQLVMPIAYDFAPDLVIISAGFDAAEGDPIGGCHLTPEVFAHMTSALQSVAPTVALLEGGYNLMATAASTEATLRVLLGERPAPLPAGHPPSAAGLAAVAQAMRIQAKYWSVLGGMVGALSRVLTPTVVHHQRTSSLGLPRPFSAAQLHVTGSVRQFDDAYNGYDGPHNGEAWDWEENEAEEEEEEEEEYQEEEEEPYEEEAGWGIPSFHPEGCPVAEFEIDDEYVVPAVERGGDDSVGDGSGQTARVDSGSPPDNSPSRLPSFTFKTEAGGEPTSPVTFQVIDTPAAQPVAAGASAPKSAAGGSADTAESNRIKAARMWQKMVLKAIVMKRSGKHGVRINGLPRQE